MNVYTRCKRNLSEDISYKRKDTKDGKVGGLMKHAGKNVMIIVTKKENK